MNNILYIAHRVNTIKELINIPIEYGIEVDIRDFGDQLILSHDPYKNGECLDEYLKYYKHSFIILNIKSEGIEWNVIKLLQKYEIDNYFFLDSSFPMIYKLLNHNECKIAIRYSEFEGMDTLRNMKKRPLFVWVDCFTKFPLSLHDFNEIKEMGMKICYVSPELQNQPEKILEYKNLIITHHLFPNMICSKLKNIKEWML